MILVQLAWFEFVVILIFGMLWIYERFARQEADKTADNYKARWLTTTKEYETEQIKRLRAERKVRELQENLNSFAKVYLDAVRPLS